MAEHAVVLQRIKTETKKDKQLQKFIRGFEREIGRATGKTKTSHSFTVLERTKGRYQGRDTDKIKKATKKSDSCESSDDEFITQSVAHMKIKKVQNISHSNGMGGDLIQDKQRRQGWRHQRE